MIDCPECIAATMQPHAIFRASCQGCAARAVSRGPNFHASATAGRLTPEYCAELARYGVTHLQAKAARLCDFEAQEADRCSTP